jgi:hypothetical protein
VVREHTSIRWLESTLLLGVVVREHTSIRWLESTLLLGG